VRVSGVSTHGSLAGVTSDQHHAQAHAASHQAGGADVPNNSVPVGAIIMWSGLLANIPAGWALCDGLGGRPDLRGRFIQGAAAGINPGAIGGATTHTHTGHAAHVVTQPAAHAALATHQHRESGGFVNVDSSRRHSRVYGEGASQVMASGIANSTSGNPDQAGTLTEGVSGGTPDVHSGAAVDAHSAHNAPDSRPLFFDLAFIIKT
jgi:hypothetical protein